MSRWQIVVSMAAGFAALFLAYWCGAVHNDPKTIMAKVLGVLVAVDLLLLCVAMAQDDGREGSKRGVTRPEGE